MYRLGIVIPAYQEEQRLPGTLAAIAAAIPKLEGVLVERLVVADNASTDGTARVARGVAAQQGLPLSVIEVRAGGKGGTLRAAVPGPVQSAPELDGILFLDADNATDLAEIARFDLSGPPQIWIGSRYLPGSRIVSRHHRVPVVRRILSRAMRALTGRLLQLPERDTQCGFKLVPAAWASDLFGRLRTEGWTFDAELLARAHRAGYPVREVPVRWVEMSGSKVRPLRDALRSVVELVRMRFLLGREAR